LAEFIPGAGQVLMATRLVTSLLSFLASDEFAEIRDKVLDDPAGFIEELAKLVAGELFRPERIADWILLGALVPSQLNSLKASPKQRPPRAKNRPGTIAKFAAVIRKLVTVGQGFYRSLSRVRRRGGQAYLGIESFVHIHPALLLGFEIAGDYVEVLPEAARLVGRAVSAGDLKAAFTGFPTTFGNIIAAINSLEIPHEFRDESVGGLNTVFAKIGVPTFQPNEAGEVKLTKSGSEFPEAEAMLTEEPDPLLRYVPVTAPGPGAPMSDPIRTHLERRFGHDFTHVRVHHGEEARSV